MFYLLASSAPFGLGCWHRTGSRGSYIEKERQRTKTKGSTQGDRLGAKNQVAIVLGSVVVTVVVIIIIRRAEKVQRATLCLLSPFHDLQRLTLMESEADERQFAQADKTVHYREANPNPTPQHGPTGELRSTTTCIYRSKSRLVIASCYRTIGYASKFEPSFGQNRETKWIPTDMAGTRLWQAYLESQKAAYIAKTL